MTKDDLIRMADLAGYDVDDDDDVYAPAQGRYGLDPRLEHFAQLVSELVRQDERETCAKFFDANDDRLFWGSAAAKEIRGRTE